MANLKDWIIREIPNALAQDIVVKHHYLHRKAPCSKAFGLYDETDTLKGVIIYGTPSSAPLRSGIAGKDEALNVIELTRLWIEDNTPKNAESYLIGNTLKGCGKEIVVSFADSAQDHVGTVYQATNWLYTGLSAKRTDWTVKGSDKHGHTWADKYTAEQMRATFGENFILTPRSRKHRYIFINAKGKRKRELLNKLRYSIHPYPKAM